MKCWNNPNNENFLLNILDWGYLICYKIIGLMLLKILSYFRDRDCQKQFSKVNFLMNTYFSLVNVVTGWCFAFIKSIKKCNTYQCNESIFALQKYSLSYCIWNSKKERSLCLLFLKFCWYYKLQVLKSSDILILYDSMIYSYDFKIFREFFNYLFTTLLYFVQNKEKKKRT